MKKKDVLKKTVKKSSPKKSNKVDKEEKDLRPQATKEHLEGFNEQMKQRNLPYRAELDGDRHIVIRNTKYGSIMKTYEIFRNMKANKEDSRNQVITFRQKK
jgi:hypothetical protein